MIVGEIIIDHYVFCEPLGKSGKDAVLSIKRKKEEFYTGGSISIAKLLSTFCKNIEILSFVGEKKEQWKLINKDLAKNTKTKLILKKNSSTIIKTRFIDEVSNFKLLGVYDFNDSFLSQNENKKFEKLFNSSYKKSDLIIVADYGHGLINDSLAKKISKVKKFKTLNAQLNAGNIGHHSINKYNSADALIINENELRHEMRDKNSSIESLISKFCKKNNFRNMIVTQGKDGSIYFNKKNKNFLHTPAFETKPVDKVGAGDTLLTIFSIFFFITKCPHLSMLIASIAAGENVKNFANSYQLDQKKLIKIIQHILK